MPFIADWKKAKTEFETTTGKKKPTEKFVGFIRKGTGIETAIKAIDAAKKAADMQKAVKQLDAAAATYIGTLEKAAANNTIVPKDDLPVYRTAIAKLEKALKDIVADADDMAGRLDDVGGKDAVDPKVLQAAEAHLALRKRMVGETAKWLANTKEHATEADRMLALAKKQLVEVKKQVKEQNQMLAQTALGVIQQAAMKARSIATDAKAELKEQGKNGGDLIKSRTDFAQVDQLPKAMQAKYKADSGKPFNEATRNVDEQNRIVADIFATADEVDGLYDEAEAAAGVVKSPAQYIEQIGKIAAGVEEVRKGASTRVLKVTDLEKKIPERKSNSTPAEGKIKYFNQQLGALDTWLKLTATGLQKVNQAEARLRLVPQGALADPGVNKAMTDANKVIADVRTLGDTIRDSGANAKKAMEEAIRELS